jgi:hypothetical protein
VIKLKPNEIELRGSWELVGNSMKADEVSQRIETLISTYLIEAGEDESGWIKLYQDPEDKRYWELSYPESEMHGGGPPLLRNLSLQEVEKILR